MTTQMHFRLTCGVSAIEFDVPREDAMTVEAPKLVARYFSAPVAAILETECKRECQLHSLLPLPIGCTYARYVGDMREVVQYSIHSDGYLVRHDWLVNGVKKCILGQPIEYQELPNHTETEIEAAIAVRRNLVLQERGITA